jgi:hypothetical protein
MSVAQRLPGHTRDGRKPSAAPGRRRRFVSYAFMGLLGVIVFAGAYPPPSSPPGPTAPSAPQPMGTAPPVANAPSSLGPPVMNAPGSLEPAASPLDEPLRLVALAREAYKGVQDYSCRLVKRERIDGKLQPQNIMVMNVRTQPFSVYFRWQEPPGLAGQEACYVAGRNDGKMRVRARGLLGAVGFMSLDPNDARARENNRHAITEAGIGHLIEQCASGWEQERRWGQSQVQLAEYEYDRHRCVRVEVIHPTNPEGHFWHYRDVVFFDKENHLPVRMEAYDWPHRPGDPGDLLESYSYAGLRLNAGIPEDVFNH